MPPLAEVKWRSGSQEGTAVLGLRQAPRRSPPSSRSRRSPRTLFLARLLPQHPLMSVFGSSGLISSGPWCHSSHDAQDSKTILYFSPASCGLECKTIPCQPLGLSLLQQPLNSNLFDLPEGPHWPQLCLLNSGRLPGSGEAAPPCTVTSIQVASRDHPKGSPSLQDPVPALPVVQCLKTTNSIHSVQFSICSRG